jgi:hypothetical protein
MSVLSGIQDTFYLLAREGKEPSFIEIEANDYAALLNEMESQQSYYLRDPMPEPPVAKYTVNWFGAIDSKEYDHSAPAYLDALKKWQDQQEAKSKEPQKLVMWAPWGQVEIKMKK